MIHSTAVALVHTYNVHARSQTIPGYSQHVLRFCRSLQAVHYNERQRVAAIALPVTQAENTDAGLDFDQSPFRERQLNSPLQKKAGKGLYMAAPQPSARLKTGADRDRSLVIQKGILALGYRPRRLRSLRSSHRLILIEPVGCLVIKRKTPCRRSDNDAYF